jgi:hypothetical protein
MPTGTPMDSDYIKKVPAWNRWPPHSQWASHPAKTGYYLSNENLANEVEHVSIILHLNTQLLAPRPWASMQTELGLSVRYSHRKRLSNKPEQQMELEHIINF